MPEEISKSQEPTRPDWAPADLPDAAVNLIALEQWLEAKGFRKLLPGLASADSAEFLRAGRAFQALFVTHCTAWHARGRHDALESRARLRVIWIVVGAAAGAVLASIVIGVTL